MVTVYKGFAKVLYYYTRWESYKIRFFFLFYSIPIKVSWRNMFLHTKERDFTLERFRAHVYKFIAIRNERINSITSETTYSYTVILKSKATTRRNARINLYNFLLCLGILKLNFNSPSNQNVKPQRMTIR